VASHRRYPPTHPAQQKLALQISLCVWTVNLQSLFLLCVSVVYKMHDKLTSLVRALKEVRVGFILIGSGSIFSLFIAYVFI
jgi:hypothetical protein